MYAVKELMHAFHNIGIPQLILADIVKTAMGLYSAPDILPAGSDENDQRLIVEGCQAFTGFDPVYTIQMYIHNGGVVAIGGGRIEKELGAAEMVDPDFFGPGRPEQELLSALLKWSILISSVPAARSRSCFMLAVSFGSSSIIAILISGKAYTSLLSI